MSAVPGSIAALFSVLLKLFDLAWHRWNHRNLCLADCITTFGLAQMEPQELVPYRRYRALGAVYVTLDLLFAGQAAADMRAVAGVRFPVGHERGRRSGLHAEMEKIGESSSEGRTSEVPDGYTVTVGSEGFRWPEVLSNRALSAGRPAKPPGVGDIGF